MKTIKHILSNRSASNSTSLLRTLLNKKYLPDRKEITIIVDHLTRQDCYDELTPLLWVLASHVAAEPKLIRRAFETIMENQYLPTHEVVRRSLPQALSYLLRKLPSDEKSELITKLSLDAPNHLRFAIAEHFLANNRVLDALRLMIKMLPKLNTDHDITDAICIHFTEYITPEVAKHLKAEADDARRLNNNDYADDISWALEFARTAP